MQRAVWYIVTVALAVFVTACSDREEAVEQKPSAEQRGSAAKR
jgi:hypothetical protein